MLSYQAELLAQLADRLTRHARTVPWVFAAVGAGVGVGAGIFLTVFLIPGGGPLYIVAAAAVLTGVAYFVGHGRALGLQLQAQAALCQMKAEENSRSLHR